MYEAPLVDRGTFVGVLTLYTDSSLPITAGQQRMMEALAPHVACILRSGSTNAAGRSTAVRPSEARSGQDQRTWGRAPAATQ